MSVLLTGSSGYIGLNLLKRLELENIDITLLARKENQRHKTYICDFAEQKIPEEAFNNVDTVYHLAGCAHKTNKDKLKNYYFKLNTQIVIDMAKIAIKKKVKKFIFISSVKAENPKEIYGISKRNAENHLLELSKISNLNVVIIRPALVYGGQVKGNLKLMMDGIRSGWLPPLPNIKNKRSLIHVDDLVSAILFLNNTKILNDKVYVATDGKNYSTFEIYNIMCKILNKKVPKWRLPKSFFSLISFVHPVIKNKVESLLGNDCYSSRKLESLGFKAKKTLYDF